MERGATVGQKAFEKWEWPGSWGLEHKWLGPRPRRLDQTSLDQTGPDWSQITPCQTRSYQANERKTRQATDAQIAEEKDLTRPHQIKSRQTTQTR